MKTIKIRLANGQLAEMRVTDGQHESFIAIQRPYWREEKRKERRGLSLEQFIEENDWDIPDEKFNLEALFIDREDDEQKPLLLEKLRVGLKTLSDKQASAIHKRFFLRMTYEEIANEEGVKKQTIDERIQSALNKLKKLF